MKVMQGWLRRCVTPRRSILKVGMATLSLPIAAKAEYSIVDLPGFQLGTPQASPALPGLAMAVTESRFPTTVPFGVAMQQAGLSVHRIDGDVSNLWFDHIAPRAGVRHVSWVAGCTAADTILGLEQMAARHRATTRVRIEHRQAGTRIEHHIFAPQALLRPLGAVLTRSRTWQADLARVLNACSHDTLTMPRANCTVLSREAAPLPLPATLVTWLLGPSGD